MNILLIGILVVFLGFGLIGSLIPNMPGTSVIFLGVLFYGLLDKFQHFSPWFLLILFIMTIGGSVGQYFIAGIGAKKFGSSRYGIIGAIIGLFFGLFFIPLTGGFLIGTFLGAIIAEAFFTFKNRKEVLKAGIGAVLGTMASLLFEFFIAIAMITMVTLAILIRDV